MEQPAAPPIVVPVPVTEVPPAPPAPSPTGTALVSPKLAPYFAALFSVATVVAGAGQIPGLNIPPAVTGYAGLLALVFAGLLGLTPGLRKAAP